MVLLLLLKEILNIHCESAGKNRFGKNKEELQEQNLKWLDNCIINLLTVIILDKFSDFVSDIAVSPVQETCSQVISIIMKHISIDSLKNIYNILLSLIKNDNWEVKKLIFFINN